MLWKRDKMLLFWSAEAFLPDIANHENLTIKMNTSICIELQTMYTHAKENKINVGKIVMVLRANNKGGRLATLPYTSRINKNKLNPIVVFNSQTPEHVDNDLMYPKR